MRTETNAERLENMSPIGVDNDGNLLVKHDDWFWLQEQAEQNEVYRLALKVYATKINYIQSLTEKDYDIPCRIVKDRGEIARQALGESHEQT